MKTKTTTCPVRLSEQENTSLDVKAKLLGTNKSSLLRDGAFNYWDKTGKIKADELFKLYHTTTQDNKEIIVDIIFQYYRTIGYPHHFVSSAQLKKTMQTLSQTKSPLIDENDLQVNTYGLTIANNFHPHMVKVRCLTNYLSPFELFNNDERLRDAIKRWLDLKNKPSHSGIRRILRTRDGVRSVVNFKPAIAKYFYDTYVPQNGKVLDPCAGYGGRLTGCIAANKNIHYTGIDPHGPTAIGNMKLASFYAGQFDNFGEREWKFDFSFHLGCAEDIMPTLQNKFHLIYSSPPFFAVEKYSDEPTQSYLRYSTYDKWRDGFLYLLAVNSKNLITDNGYIIYNVKDYKKAPIATDLCSICSNIGLKLIKTYAMRLANSEYHRGVNSKKMYHSEPIFVFKKG